MLKDAFIWLLVFLLGYAVFVVKSYGEEEIVPLIVLETLIYEASGEDIEGMLYVACVIRNRALERNLTLKQVVLQPKQFSCWNDGVPEQRIYQRWELDRALQAWRLSKQYKDFKANLYHADYVLPYWAKDSRVKFIKQVGHHLFYREER